MGTIPASLDVNVLPGVVGAGGTALDTIGLMLTTSALVPIAPLGSVLSFPDEPSVASYFGAASWQATLASNYFNGFANRTSVPDSMLFAQYPAWDVAAYLRGGTLTQTLAQLTALTGSLTVTMDGYPSAIASINLSGNASLSAIATSLTAAFVEPTEASFTGSMGSTFVATGSGTSLTVASISAGYISAGDSITGTGVPASTKIVSQTSGTAGGAGVYVTNNATTSSGATITGTSANIDVTVVASGTLSAGQTVSGGTVTANTIIVSQVSGATGGVGVYATKIGDVSTQQNVASASLTAKATAPVVTYSSQFGAFVVTSGITGGASTAAYATGTLATALGLTQAAGAVLSQGASATTPAAFMAALTAQSKNWVSFSHDFDPDACFFVGTISGTTLTVDQVFTGALAIGDTISGGTVAANTVITAGSGTSWTVSVSQTVSTPTNMTSWLTGGGHGNTQKLAFAAWNNSVPELYAYVMWDTDVSPTLSAAATGSAGYIVTTGLKYEGTIPLWQPSQLGHSAILMGMIASIDFDQTNGRTNFKFRTQSGVVPAVTDTTVATNLGSGSSNGQNGYNFFAAMATASDSFNYLRNGQISGEFKWIDSFINQVWLNNAMQQALISLLTSVGSIPYNPAGYNMIKTTLSGGATPPVSLPPQSPVASALNFGAIRSNVPLSAAQAQAVNSAAGATIDGVLSTRGWYLQVLPPSATVRANRGSPIVNFWYTDGESVNQITVSSTEIQ